MSSSSPKIASSVDSIAQISSAVTVVGRIGHDDPAELRSPMNAMKQSRRPLPPPRTAPRESAAMINCRNAGERKQNKNRHTGEKHRSQRRLATGTPIPFTTE